jgi:hypothetical protein
MASPNLGIIHIAAAQNQPEVTANGAFDLLDDSINLEVFIAMADADATLTQAQLASGGVIQMTGALTANRKIILPGSIGRLFVFQNATTGGFNLIVQTSSGVGTTVSVPPSGNLLLLYSDGTNVTQVSGGASSGGGGGGGTVPNFADEETPGGTIDGSNTAFTLANAPSPAASLILVRASGAGGGAVLTAGGVDFTLSGANITMANPPAVGDTLLAWYRH